MARETEDPEICTKPDDPGVEQARKARSGDPSADHVKDVQLQGQARLGQQSRLPGKWL